MEREAADADKISVFSISPTRSFVDVLASGILEEVGGDPLRLADYTILLPTRRACRALIDAFLRQSDGTPLILPALRPLGDIDEDSLLLDETPGLDDLDLPPPLPPMRRAIMLSERILQWRTGFETGAEAPLSPDQALHLAQELARFLDQVQTERLGFDGLAQLVPDELAEHWQVTLAFLRHFTDDWSAAVEASGFMEPVRRRNLLMAATCRLWAESAPEGPIIAAGSTGSIPATADLLAVVAGLPHGRVILPGLDTESDADTWRAVEDDPTHPQYAMAGLLKRIGIARDAVEECFPEAETQPGHRPALIREMLRPARTTGVWQSLPPFDRSAFEGLELLECADEIEETGAIALMLRETLETEGKSAALVTTDRRLARRVAAELKRWNIEIDDSAGMPLSQTPPATYMRLVAETMADAFGPVSLLSLGKHPVTAAGFAPPRFRSLVRLLDRTVLRGARPAPGITGLREVTAAAEERVLDKAAKGDLGLLFDAMEVRLAPMLQLGDGDIPFGELVDAHIAAAEALAETPDENGASRLWHGDAGEALALFFGELRESADAARPLALADYPGVIEALMGAQVVRPRYGRHPRLFIWGPPEARLQRADRLILGGLNEGAWPREPSPDPWLSRPMRAQFGLPPHEARIGLSAHDFAQALSAPEVVLTRPRKIDGAPAVPTRWLSRLQSVLKATGQEKDLGTPGHWLDWHRMAADPGPPRPCPPPAPCPPVAVRPRRLSVTQIESWMRDPYAIYARHILRLRKLDPLEADPGAADRGTIIHGALDRFLRAYPDGLPADALERLLAIGNEVFGAALARPAVRAFWWPRFVRIAEWFIAVETENRAALAGISSEVKGKLPVSSSGGEFNLTAIADRIDRLPDGSIAIVDYKTGGVPSKKEIELGYAPQLSLEAVIAEAGGFEDLDAGEVRALSYWQLSGGEPPGQIRPVTADIAAIKLDALEGLRELVTSFDRPETTYSAVPAPAFKPRFNDFSHLERVLEWAGADGGEE